MYVPILTFQSKVDNCCRERNYSSVDSMSAGHVVKNLLKVAFLKNCRLFAIRHSTALYATAFALILSWCCLQETPWKLRYARECDMLEIFYMWHDYKKLIQYPVRCQYQYFNTCMCFRHIVWGNLWPTENAVYTKEPTKFKPDSSQSRAFKWTLFSMMRSAAMVKYILICWSKLCRQVEIKLQSVMLIVYKSILI